MIIYRVFDGDTYMHFSKRHRALDVADKIADEEDAGPNGFVIVDKLTLANRTPKSLVLAALNRQSTVIEIERIYERMAR